MIEREAWKMALVRVKGKFQVTLPSEVREHAGIDVGDYLDARVGAKGVITLIPQSFIDRSIAESLADARAGRKYGPFKSGAAMGASIETEIRRQGLRQGGERRAKSR